MPKVMTISGMVVAGLIGLAFAADLVLGVPFGGASMLMDIGSLVAAGLLGYLSWDAMRELH
jgi:hypothetical protein